VRVRAEPFARLNNVVVQDAKDSETDVVGIAVFGKRKMKMAVQPAVPSPSHLFTVNVLNHKKLFYILLIFLFRISNRPSLFSQRYHFFRYKLALNHSQANLPLHVDNLLNSECSEEDWG
jgi:hypothetical protein